jgi:hypothetical protein
MYQLPLSHDTGWLYRQDFSVDFLFNSAAIQNICPRLELVTRDEFASNHSR